MRVSVRVVCFFGCLRRLPVSVWVFSLVWQGLGLRNGRSRRISRSFVERMRCVGMVSGWSIAHFGSECVFRSGGCHHHQSSRVVIGYAASGDDDNTRHGLNMAFALRAEGPPGSTLIVSDEFLPRTSVGEIDRGVKVALRGTNFTPLWCSNEIS